MGHGNVSIRVMLEFERSREQHCWQHDFLTGVSIRVLLELERSFDLNRRFKNDASQSEFCWSLRDPFVRQYFIGS